MDTELHIFVAGSKNLRRERALCRNVCSKLQNKFGRITVKTYEDFRNDIPHKESNQKEYNDYIMHEADIFLCLVSGEVGEYTMEEIKCAYQAFKKSKHPRIFIYVDSNKKADAKIKNFCDGIGYYYNEYDSISDLEAKLNEHLNNFMVKKKWKERFSSALIKTSALFAIWLVMSILGGMGMFIYDNYFNKTNCQRCALENIRTYDGTNKFPSRDGKYVYAFRDKNLEYDFYTKKIDTIAVTRNPIITAGSLYSNLEIATTCTIKRFLKYGRKMHGRNIVVYVAVGASVLVGCGAGIIVEQMIFPPEYSENMCNYLSDSKNWDYVINLSSPRQVDINKLLKNMNNFPNDSNSKKH